MNFIKAVRNLRRGLKVKRVGWHRNHYLSLIEIQSNESTVEVIIEHNQNGTMTIFYPTVENIISTYWLLKDE